MPEFRKDPLVHRWIVMAPERANRPVDVKEIEDVSQAAFDPFLEGQESVTTPEILAYREPNSTADGPGWRVRVVPNKFPAVHSDGSTEHRRDGIYEFVDGVGAHEVIVECPHFETSLARLSVENVREVLSIYRDRLAALKGDSRLVHAVIFKNKGFMAGASLPHSHSQLIATPVVPISILEEIDGARRFHDSQGRSLFAEMIAQELATRLRVVMETPRFLVICPYASRFPYEMCILPKQQGSHFENITSPEIDELGMVLKRVLQKLEVTLNDPPYNYVIHTAPFNQPELPFFSWHIEIFPRLTRVAGFEWGSGFYINEVLPETAAAVLRAAVVD